MAAPRFLDLRHSWFGEDRREVVRLRALAFAGQSAANEKAKTGALRSG
jgi:hypothetical protein